MKEHWTYRSEYIKCGKASCSSCPHGPYWYGYRHELGKLHKKYFGKLDPRPRTQTYKEEAVDGREDILSRETASVKLAAYILGIDENCDMKTARSAFRKLTLENHPDRGGDHKTYTYISAAWSWLRAFRSW